MALLQAFYRFSRILTILVVAIGPGLADAGLEEPTVRIGVLAYRGSEAVQEDWSYVTHWLSSSIPGYRFVLQDYDQAGLTRAAHEQAVDFIITGSGHYVSLEHSDGASRIATLESPWAKSTIKAIGSAIVVRRDSPLLALADLAGRHVLAVGADAFGGYQVAARELLEAGVDPERDFGKIQFSGFPIQAILLAVRDGRADAGIVPACLLEKMVGSGEIAAGALRVLAPQEIKDFPCQTSSRLYPNWPFAALAHTPAPLSKRVAVALLQMPRTAEGYSWAIPSDYQTVDELYRELKIGPYANLRLWTFAGLLQRFWGWILLALGVLVIWAVHTVRVEYLIAQRTLALRAAQQEQRRMEEEARKRQATLDHTARLAILGEMASAIAHELNQPLAAIGNFARGMVRRIAAGRLEPEPLLDGAHEIIGQSERAADIIRNIRLFAKKQAPECRAIDLLPLIGEAIAFFSGTQADTPIVWQPAALSEAAIVQADPLQVQQVVLNLLKNAQDAQLSAGRAGVPIEVRLYAEGSFYRVAVRDSGCGLEPEQFARLFEPFFSTKPEGLGLGLSLSKSIIESYGGTLSASGNEGGVGLTVCFSLPEMKFPREK
ncbi:MAG: sensor histidine kinase [Burkholderiales bacterium]